MSSVLRFDEWQDSDGNPVFNGAGGVSPGGLVAVKSAIRDIPFVSPPVAAGGNVAVPDLEITHEMADPANRLIISAFFGAAANAEGRNQVGIALDDGTGLIAVGTPAGNRVSVGAGGFAHDPVGLFLTVNLSVCFVHTPGDTASRTYTVRALNIAGSSRTLFINRSVSDEDAASRSRAVSSLVIQEVTV